MHTILVQRTGGGSGTVTSDNGIACGSMCIASLPAGTFVQLIAQPAAHMLFTEWSGPCTGTNPTCNFVVGTADVTVGAAFEKKRDIVHVAVGGNGSGTVTGTGLSCPGTCSVTVDEGSSVVLTGAAQTGSHFLGWSGGGCSGTSPCVVAVNDGDVTVQASFGTTGALVVTRTGAGSGTVTSSPAGISCGGDCSEVYTSGTAVTLTAAPGVESAFAGWSGAGCTGTSTCSVVMGTGSVVTAAFNRSCGGVGQACCSNAPRCNDGSGCLSGTCTACPAPPVTTTRLFIPNDSDGSNCGNISNVHTYSVRCTDGNHHEQCQPTVLSAPPQGGASCTFDGWVNPNDPGDCSCNVRFAVNTSFPDCMRRIACSVTITQTTNPPPHPDGCP
jgi:uncharacterized protein (DUF779 family)